MDRLRLKTAFGVLVADEPPFQPDVERVVRTAGRRRRRRAMTRAFVSTSVAAVAATVVVAALPQQAARESGAANETLSLLTFASNRTGAHKSFENGERSSTEFLQRILPTIRANSPGGFRLDLYATDFDDTTTFIDGTVDDGRGEGRLFIAMSSETGSTVEDPCSDPEFRQGASCSTQALEDGSKLVLRGVADFEGIGTLAVVLVRPDGSGIYAESGNWRLSDETGSPQPVREGGEEKIDSPPLDRTRPEPVYTIEQLAKLIRAIDAQI